VKRWQHALGTLSVDAAGGEQQLQRDEHAGSV